MSPAGWTWLPYPASDIIPLSANLNVSDHSGVLRLRPAMKRRNRTQQEGPVEPKEISTISMTRIRPETGSQKAQVKLVSTELGKLIL